MEKNFKTRAIVGFSMLFVSLVGLYLFDSLPFKILFAIFTVVAAIELFSFFKSSHKAINFVLAILEFGFLIGGMLFVFKTKMPDFWYVILGIPGYDVFAYLFGNIFGGKVFKSRPFPKISKGKTWEGTILGLLCSVGLVALLLSFRETFSTDYIYLLSGPLALAGDLFESYLKRTFKVKDSNEIVIKNKFFSKLEIIVGGSEGHGGFLDRIDSTAFATTILLIISLFL